MILGNRQIKVDGLEMAYGSFVVMRNLDFTVEEVRSL